MYTFMKCLSFLICHIPFFMRRGLGSFFGAFFWTFVPKKRKILARDQILECGLTADAGEAMAIAKASTTRFGRMIIEVLSYPVYDKEILDKKIVFHGKEYLDGRDFYGFPCRELGASRRVFGDERLSSHIGGAAAGQ